VKLEEEEKALLLSFLPPSYDHLATTIMYGKEILELKDVSQMLQNNELMKKTYFTEEALGLVVNEQRGRSQSRRPKKGTKTSSENLDCYYCKQPGHMKMNCFKYKEILKKNGGPGPDGVSTSGEQMNQAGVIEEAVEEPCDLLSSESGQRQREVLGCLVA